MSHYGYSRRRARPIFARPAAPQSPKKPRQKWRILPRLWTGLKRLCLMLGALMLVYMVLAAMFMNSIMHHIDTQLPETMVLSLTIDGDLAEVPTQDTVLDAFAPPKMTLRQTIAAIDAAAQDPRVKGLYAEIESGGLALAHVQELRTALKNFRDSGKVTHVYAPSYNHGIGSYYLVSAFEHIWMEPMGTMMIGGINFEMPFFRKVLDIIGVTPQFYQRKDYKNAYASVTESAMPTAQREAMTALVDDMADILLTDIAADRDLTPDALMAQIDKAILFGDDILASQLITAFAHKFKVEDHVLHGEHIDANPTYPDFITVSHYYGVQQAIAAKSDGKDKDKAARPSVAIIHVDGAIMATDPAAMQAPSVMFGEAVAAADDIIDALYEANNDDTIKAVVIRVNSPGGSPVASDMIAQSMARLRDSGKPVIVSLGAVAASGGYWVAASGDYIFANPSTVTGSIGVLGGKMSAQDLWDKIGVSWDGIAWGENADLFSFNQPFSDSGAARMNAMMDFVYDRFLTVVATGRDMSLAEVEAVAQGRVWSGRDAKARGLVDSFGGLNEALDYAAGLTGQDSRDDVNVVILPAPLSPFEQFIAMLEGEVMLGKMMRTQAMVFDKVMRVVSGQTPVAADQGLVYDNTVPILR